MTTQKTTTTVSSGRSTPVRPNDSEGESLDKAYVLTLSREGPKRNDPSENQDACISWTDEATGVMFLAIADGHGSPSHDRSGTGSQLAVESAKKVVRDFIVASREVLQDTGRHAEFKDWWTGPLFREIHREWASKVDGDIEDHFRMGEPFFSSDKESATGTTMEDSHVKYGTTLLLALTCGKLVALGQVGDGLAAVAGKNVQFPLLPEGEDLDNTSNITDSLCSAAPDARFQVFSGKKPPRLILLCTDGIDNGFDSVASFQNWVAEQAGSESIRDRNTFEQALAQGAAKISTYSGDDATVGTIFFPEGDLPECETQDSSLISGTPSQNENQDTRENPELKNSALHTDSHTRIN